MDPRVQALWTTALRSDEFPQGRIRLKSEDGGFCCLGVLCELHHREHPEEGEWVEEYYRGAGPRPAYKTNNLTEGHVLPEKVRVWAGMKSITGAVVGTNGKPSLVGLNDTGRTFPEIANYIDAYAEAL